MMTEDQFAKKVKKLKGKRSDPKWPAYVAMLRVKHGLPAEPEPVTKEIEEIPAEQAGIAAGA